MRCAETAHRAAPWRRAAGETRRRPPITDKSLTSQEAVQEEGCMKARDFSAARRATRRSLMVTAALVGSIAASAPAFAADQTTEPGPPAAQDVAPAGQPPADQSADQPRDIVVTGSRLSAAGFNTPTPVTTLGAERLTKMGTTNIGEALATLPSFRASSSPSNSVVGSNISPVNAGARIADLRGLGQARTLVLVDSQRFSPSTSTGTV